MNIIAGDVRLGGTVAPTTPVNLNGPGAQVFPNDPNALLYANDLVSQLQNASTIFADMAATSNVVQNGTTYTLNAVPGADGIAVFELAASVLTTQNVNLVLNAAGLPPETTIIINVIGEVVTGPGSLIQPNFQGDFLTDARRDYLMWNFHDQTDLVGGTVRFPIDREWQGSLLVPNADIEIVGPVNGSVYVGGGLIQRAEIRMGYAGALPTAIPEPSGLTLLSLAAVGFVGSKCRRRFFLRRQSLRLPAC